MNPCPKCHGRGTFEETAILCHRGGTSSIQHGRRACVTCDATGLITEERLADVRAGEAARADRVHGRYRSMREEAAILGITEQELSKWENYGIKPEAWTR